jgi:hypothetical protein
MTGQLRTTMQTRADDLGPLDLDLDAIVRGGNRRLRRRRTVLAGGVAGTLAVVAGAAALTFGGHSGSRAIQPADSAAKPLSYAVGSVIHSGDTTIDVGEKVVSFVQTHWGFVFSTSDHRLHQVRDGQVGPITTFDGHPSQLAGSTPLVTGDDGLLTAWWDGERIQTWPGYRSGDGMVDAFDKTNSFNAASSWPSSDPPRIQAVSDGHLWFWDGQDPWIAEVRPMTSTAGWKDTNPPGSGTVVDAAGERVLVNLGGGMAVTRANLRPLDRAGIATWQPGGDLANLDVQVPDVSSGDLAPDGKHWFTQDADQFAVFDSTTGERQDVAFKKLGFDFAAPYQWLGNDTIAALALPKAATGLQPISLLTCHVSTNDCVVTARDIGDATDVALPIGQSLQNQ